MKQFFLKYLKGDLTIWLIIFFLLIISALELFSASSSLVSRNDSILGPFSRHMLFWALGLTIIVFIQNVHVKYIRLASFLFLALAILLLLATTVYGVAVGDAARWFKVFGASFQPSELAKIGLIVVVAHFVDRSRNEEFQERWFTKMAVVITLTCGLIFTENFSTATMLFTVVFVMLVVGQIALKKVLSFIAVIVSMVAVFCIVAIMFGDYIDRNGGVKSQDAIVQKLYSPFERVVTWQKRIVNYAKTKDDASNKFIINDANMQVQHAQIAISRGGAFGVLPGNSQQRNFLPEAFSDFIYAIILEELGLIGGVFVLLLYLTLLFRAGVIASRCKSVFPAILILGVAMIVVIQAFIHMSVAVNLIPVTGQPLPMISRGGTSILVTSLYLGIMLSVSRQLKEEAEQEARKAQEDMVSELEIE